MKLPNKPFPFIFKFVRQQWVKFSLIAFASIMWALNDSIYPFFLKNIVNALQSNQGDRTHIYGAVSTILFLLMAFWITSEIFNRMQGILQIYVWPRFRASMRESVFDYVKLHSHDYFSSNFAGNLAKKIADLPNSCQTMMEIICFQFITAGTGAILVLVMMWHIMPLFAEILLVWLCVHLGITFLFMRYGNTLWERHSESVSTLSGKIVDVFTNILTVRLFARGEYETKYLQSYQNDEIAKAKKAMWLIELMRIGLGLNGLFLIFGMVTTLLYGWVHHWVTIGDFTQIGMQSFWILGWVWFVCFQITVFARELGTVTDSLTLVKRGHDLVDSPDAKSIVIKNGEIEFKDVSFSYNKKENVFSHLNLTIPGGQKIGLVGFSGSGKSTFVNLILRFYDIQAGKILIDHHNIADMTQDSLRSQIAMIPQDPMLFHRTLMENIRYGREDASDEEVIEASKLAHCHEFIDKLDDKYHALVGERGIKLSGGQRQRIAIARAVLKNAPILILDEATSSLDSVTEKLIQESLHQLMQNKTTIVIAHRLSTLSDMDRILVFHQGKIVEDGTKQALLANGGHFQKLWNMQTDGYLPEI